MSVPGENEVIIDKDIPIEMQINFLRNGLFDRDLVTYKVLKEQLGEKGEEIYEAIKDGILQQMASDIKMKLEFADIKRQAGGPDKMLGYLVERGLETDDEIQIDLLNCPYFERSKKFGLEKEVCRFICDLEAKQAVKIGCEMTLLSRISDGDDKCTIKLQMK